MPAGRPNGLGVRLAVARVREPGRGPSVELVREKGPRSVEPLRERAPLSVEPVEPLRENGSGLSVEPSPVTQMHALKAGEKCLEVF